MMVSDSIGMSMIDEEAKQSVVSSNIANVSNIVTSSVLEEPPKL